MTGWISGRLSQNQTTKAMKLALGAVIQFTLTSDLSEGWQPDIPKGLTVVSHYY